MNTIPHLPVLRLGRSYESLDKLEIKDHRTGEVKAVVSTINAGILRKDFRRLGEARAALKKFTVAQLIEMSAKAGELFLNGTLPLGDKGHTQSADEYVATLSATSGLPHVMVRRNMAKIHHALTHLGEVLNGLSRGLDLTILDTRFRRAVRHEALVFPDLPGARAGHAEQFARGQFALAAGHRAQDAGRHQAGPRRAVDAVPPDPGIHRRGRAGGGVWLLSHRPRRRGRDSEELRTRADLRRQIARSQQYANNPAIQVHGPGWSKILIGDDQIENWRDYIDVMAASISENGGRSCINASAIVVPKYAAEIADALAQKLGPDRARRGTTIPRRGSAALPM